MMRTSSMWTFSLLVALLLAPLGMSLSRAADDPAPLAPAGTDLANRQKKLATRYAKLEELLIKMAKLEAASNPRRANLLNQAMELSKEKHTRLQLETIASLLGKKQLARALREQTDVELSLAELLKLLQSEDRSTELKTEQERIREYIKEVERMIRIQRSLQGQNEGQADAQKLAQEQEKLAERAADLADKIRRQEEKEQPPNKNEAKNEEGQPNQPMTPSEDKPGENKPSENKPGENKPGGSPKSGEKRESPQQPGEKSDMPPGESQESSKQEEQKADQQGPKENPVRQRIDQARQRMKAAEKKLAESKERKESLEEQEQARAELEKAKAELERILRQLREEEMERALTALEARFRKMLEMQVKVFDSTKKLAAIPAEQRTHEHDVQAGRLGADETKIAIEAEKALQLLEEEGSSVAFPATVQQMVDDMRSVAERLNLGKTDQLTQGLEEDVIACLEELLAALQQAQKEMEEKKQQSPMQQQSAGNEQEQPLVNAIQELKMIKSLQLRVNNRTNRYARLLQDENDPVGQANTSELADALEKLAGKEKQVFEIVRELLLGRNK